MEKRFVKVMTVKGNDYNEKRIAINAGLAHKAGARRHTETLENAHAIRMEIVKQVEKQLNGENIWFIEYKNNDEKEYFTIIPGRF